MDKITLDGQNNTKQKNRICDFYSFSFVPIKISMESIKNIGSFFVIKIRKEKNFDYI